MHSATVEEENSTTEMRHSNGYHMQAYNHVSCERFPLTYKESERQL